MRRRVPFSWMLLVFFLLQCRCSHGFVGRALQKVQKDFQALTRRVTARHILVADEQVALALKRKIREQSIDKNIFVVDVFAEAARKYSLDESNRENGGLLGNLVAQGYCKSSILDRACFQVPLGQLEGPIQSEYGSHLLIVTERINCPKLDGKNTRLIMQDSNDIFGTLRPSDRRGKIELTDFVKDQLGFWFLVVIAGGLVAELAEKLASLLSIQNY
eukprot:scaffold23471_cov141-Cylindrotheca_fusiformis.AAC.5